MCAHLSKRVINNNDLVVYSAIFGDIGDKLRARPNRSGDVAFVTFMDKEKVPRYRAFHAAKWQVYAPQFINENLRRQARAHKVLAHRIFKNCRYSLWIDGCFMLIDNNVDRMMEENLQEADICVFKHRRRNCIAEEVAACIEQKKDDEKVMVNQVERYFREGYPRDNGLAETTAILRRHNKATTAFNELWWHEISNGSVRDQLSFDYVAWKLGIKYDVFPGSIGKNLYFKWFRH